MKLKITVLFLIAALVAVVVFEENRISKLKVQLETSKSEPVATVERKIDSRSSQPTRVSNVTDSIRQEGTDPEKENGIGKVMRKMADNPAAKAMFAQNHIASAQMLYASLMEGFDFTEEEKKYFINLMAEEFAEQQQLGMKMMGGMSDEERSALAEEMKENKEARKEKVKEFLNDEEDAAKFSSYHDRLAEHQQMSGIRSAMEEAGVALRPEQEDAVVEAMHSTRTAGDAHLKWEGASGMELMKRDDVVEVFEEDWSAGQKVVRKKLNEVLDEVQMELFIKNQEQMKEFQLMGIKMVQGMMQNTK